MMIGYSDDAKVMELLAPLRRLEPVPFAVPQRSERRRLRRPVLVAAVVVVALALTGVAIANGVGAFNGIGAAQRPHAAADVLDAKTLAQLQDACPSDVQASFYMPFCHMLLDSARLVGALPSGRNIYVLPDTRGELCVVISGTTSSCGSALSSSNPTTAVSENDTGNDFVTYGVAIDGISAVSFTVRGREVTVPVKDNVWAFEEKSSAWEPRCITVHYADGTTFSPFPEAC